MMELIDRNALKKCAYDSEQWYGNRKGFHNQMVVDVEDIDDAPIIDAVPVVCAHWICTDETFNIWRCSSCREEWTLNDGTPKDNNMNYCFNCGSRMDGKDGEHDG